LPDYFVDRFVRVENFRELAAGITAKGIEGGGGSIRGPRQSEVKGGNAVNLAYALATLNMKVNLITIANSLPADMLRGAFRKFPTAKIEIIDGNPGFTVAFEFREKNRQVNVMVSDAGDLKKMDGSELSKQHWNKIASSKIVGFVNWAAMDYGTVVAEKVFNFAREKKIKTFFDPADVLEKEKDIADFKTKILDRGLVDYFSMNDNEARIISRSIAGYKLPQDYSESDLKKTISVLARYVNDTVDVHTHKVSMSCSKDGEVTIDYCQKVDQKTVTGAGDVWDAADLLGFLTGLAPQERLFLANAAAGLYVSRESAIPPSSEEILSFVKSLS
ncbi:MAG: carbohydrate kinase family protein, partial [Nitrososphaerales archaeon]